MTTAARSATLGRVMPRRGPDPKAVQAHHLLAIGTTVALSCVAGLAIAFLPLLASIVATGLAAFVLILALTRSVLSPTRDGLRADVADSTQDSRMTNREQVARVARAFAIPRRLYYLGLLTIGLLVFRPALSFTLSDWLFLVSLLATIVVVLRTRSAFGLQLPSGVILGAGLFALGGLISSTQAVAPLASAAVVVRILYLIIPWFWVGTVLLRTQASVHTAVNVWVISAALCSLGAVVQFFVGDVVPGGSISYGRATGFTAQFNDLGGVAAVTFVPALMVAARSREGAIRAINYCALTLIGAGLLFSGSVGALLAAAAATAVWVAAGRRARSTVVLLLVLVIAAAAFIQLGSSPDSPSPLKRFSSVTQADAPQATGGSLYSRIEVYRSAWDHIASQPLVGVGLDPESTARLLDFQVHNIVLQPWFTAGILGITGILVLVGSIIHTGLYVLKAARDTDDLSLAVSLHASFLAFVVFAMSQPVLYVRYGWVSAALLIALRSQHVRLRAETPSPQAHELRGNRESMRLAAAR